MRHIAFALLLIGASAASAGDEHWLVIKAGDGAYGYDKGSVVDKGHGHFTLATGLYTPQALSSGATSYNYLLTDSELNCTDWTYTSSTFYLFDDNAKMLDMNEGNGTWEGAEENGIMDELAKIVCSHQSVASAVDAGDMEQAMKTMRGYFK